MEENQGKSKRRGSSRQTIAQGCFGPSQTELVLENETLINGGKKLADLKLKLVLSLNKRWEFIARISTVSQLGEGKYVFNINK